MFKNIRKGAGYVFTPNQWLGFDSLKQHGSMIARLFSRVMKPHESSQVKGMSFAQCMAHFNMTSEELKKRMQTALQTALVCGATSAACLIYAIYLFAKVGFLSGLVTVGLSFVMAAYCFREHFNYFQMHEKRLGCTVKQWLNFVMKKPTTKKGGKV